MYGGKAEIPRLNRAVPVLFKIEQETDDSRALSDAYIDLPYKKGGRPN